MSTPGAIATLPSIAERQHLIIEQVGETADTLLARNMDALWAATAEKEAIDPRLHDLYITLDCYKLLRRDLRKKVDMQQLQGTSLKMSQQFSNLNDCISDIKDDIDRLEQRLAAQRVVQVGTLTQNTPPVEGPPLVGPYVPPMPPDANDTWYSGDPYKPMIRRI